MKHKEREFGSYINSQEDSKAIESLDSDSEDYQDARSEETIIVTKEKSQRAKPQRAVQVRKKYDLLGKSKEN